MLTQTDAEVEFFQFFELMIGNKFFQLEVLSLHYLLLYSLGTLLIQILTFHYIYITLSKSDD